jgi:hypothetical protein
MQKEKMVRGTGHRHSELVRSYINTGIAERQTELSEASSRASSVQSLDPVQRRVAEWVAMQQQARQVLGTVRHTPFACSRQPVR